MPERVIEAVKAATDGKAIAGGVVSLGGFTVVLSEAMPLLVQSLSAIAGLITIIYVFQGIRIRNEELQMLRRQNSALNSVDNTAEKIKGNNR